MLVMPVLLIEFPAKADYVIQVGSGEAVVRFEVLEVPLHDVDEEAEY